MHIKINLARSAGFCFGVKRALEIAFKTAKGSSPVFMLGDIVHNEDVIQDVKKSGIKKISRLSKGKGKTLLIRAHGSDIATLNKAAKLRYAIVDATCPMVKEIHRLAKLKEKKGYRVIIIGDRKHDEVLGIIGQLKNPAIVIDSPERIPFKKIRAIKKAAVLSQSTQNLENVSAIVKKLKQHIKKVDFTNTICHPTRIKQEEIRSLPLKNDVMIVIGSKTSANTRRLFEISKAINPRTYWIRRENELKPRWFKDIKKVGITAGASTPDRITQKVVQRIKKF